MPQPVDDRGTRPFVVERQPDIEETSGLFYFSSNFKSSASLLPQVDMWDVLCITCQNSDLATEIEKDLNLYQDAGVISRKTELVVVPDPKANIGSGGATFNAVLTIAERLSIRLDYSVINIQAIRGKRILVMHMGRDFQFDVAGRGLFYLPCTFHAPTIQIPIPNYLHTFLAITEQVAVDSPPGIWLTSTDIFATTSTDIYKKFDWSKSYDMVGLAVEARVEQVANRHAAYLLNDDDTLADIFYRVSEQQLRREATGSRHCDDKDNVLALLGIVYLSPSVVTSIFSFYEVYPLNSCTYMGVDSGAVPIQLSILMDVMRAAATRVSAEAFVNWNEAQPLARRARQLIYEKLHNCVYKIVVDKGGRFLFPDTDRPSLLYETLVEFAGTKPTAAIRKSMHAACYVESRVDPTSTIILNSCLGPAVSLGPSTVLTHVLIDYPAVIGEGSIINGLEAAFDSDDKLSTDDLTNDLKMINVPPQIALHQYAIRVPSIQMRTNLSVGVVVVFGLKDRLNVPISSGNDHHEDVTFCNMPFKSYLAKKQMEEADLWPLNVPQNERTLFTAKLYPILSKAKTLALALWLASPNADPVLLTKWRSSWRLSIQEMQSLVDHSASSLHRHACFTRVTCKFVERELANRDDAYLAPLYHTSVLYGFADRLLTTLDGIASQTLDERKLARVLANIAALLACMSGSRGGIRSGPAKNAAWDAAYQTLQSGDHERAVRAMASLRNAWMDSPQTLMRASRHYEGASHILIKRACQTSQAFVCLKPSTPTGSINNSNCWVVAEAPCRADLAGGWSDTPPMSYEVGGAVLNAALLVNGQRPIGARIRKTETAGIVVCNLDCSSDVTVIRQRWKFDGVDQLSGYDQSLVTGQATLAKACLYVTGIVQPVKDTANPKALLAEQLTGAFGLPGIEIHTWANLPEGSGLGTRSIIAGALIAAIWTLSGYEFDMECVCHAVVQCEQLMATCVGFQDPIGGLVGGIKLAYCQPLLPLHVRWQNISLTDSRLEQLNRKLVFIYAGNRPPFGASMIVSNVVRNWYSNEPSLVGAARRLASIAKEAAGVLEEGKAGSFDELGPLITRSHEAKKLLAPGSESESFHQITALLCDILLGATINGCGDGGFMSVLLKDEFCRQFKSKQEILTAINDMIAKSDLRHNFGEEVAAYDAAIATEGLKIWHQESP